MTGASLGQGHMEPGQRSGRGEGGACAQPREIKLIDDGGVGIGDDIDGKTIAVGEGIDMVKGESGVGRGGAHQPPGVLLDDMKRPARARAPNDSSG